LTNFVIALISLAFAGIDIISGSVTAIINGDFTTHKFKRGCLSKFSQVAIIIATMPLQVLAKDYLSIELPFTMVVLTQFIIQEAASVFENYKKLGN
jgi:phage-related holin